MLKKLLNMKPKNPRMTLERLKSRSFGKESSGFWRGGPRGLTLEDVQRYLAEGGDVNGRFDSGDTLLLNATDNGQIEIMRLLMSHGADLNAKGYHGYTALHHAVDGDCNTQNRDDYSRATDLPLTKLLIDAGADETVRDNDGQTARDFAVDYGQQEVALYDSLSRLQRS